MIKINLIKKPKKYQKYEYFFKFIRKITIFLLIIFLIIFIPFYWFLKEKNKQLELIYQEKEELLNFLAKNKETELAFLNLKGKHQLLVNFLNEDVNFLPYYNLLLDSLKHATQPPKINNVTIDNKRVVNFSLTFDDHSSFISFLKYAESDIFVDKFNKLYISNINLAGINKTTQLVFSGEFKPFNNYED